MTEEKAYELETPTVWQRIFLKSKVNGARCEEQGVGSKWSWPENTYLQRRLEYLRTYRSPDGTLISLFRTEAWETGEASEKDTMHSERDDSGASKNQKPRGEQSLMRGRDAGASLQDATLVGRGSNSGSASLRTNGTPAGHICIDIPSDDWSWCANPNIVTCYA